MGDNKVGQRLVERGLITEKQLEEALKAQQIVGGHLGTCMIELGMINETSLCEALADIFGVPSTTYAALRNIDEAVIASVPAKIADEFRVVPFKMYQNSLHVAMIDPSQLTAVDALSFATDKRIVPWVAPELRIYEALEKYYGIPRRLRYISICKALDLAAVKGARAERKAPAEPAPAEDSRSEAEIAHAEKVKRAVSMNSASVDQELSFEADLGFDYGRNWHEIAAELHLDDDDDAAAAKDRPRSASRAAAISSEAAGEKRPPASPGKVSLEEVAERFCRADTKEDIAEAILSYTFAHMSRVILFGVSRHVATPWRAKGLPVERLPQVKLPMGSGIFELLLGNEVYRGVVPREAKYETTYRILGIERPSEVLLVPLHMSDRLVAIFHGDGGTRGRITGETDDYLRLFKLFTPTLNLLILKNKIRDAVRSPAKVPSKPQAV